VFKNVSPIFLFLTRNGTALQWNIYWHCKRNWINIVFQHSTTALAVWCSVMRRVAGLVPETSLRPPPSRFCRIYYLLVIKAYPSCERSMWWKPQKRCPQPSYQILLADVT